MSVMDTRATRRGVFRDAAAPVLEESPTSPIAPQPTHSSPLSAIADPSAARRRRCASSDHPTWGGVFGEGAPLIGAPAFFGPPAILVAGPWLLVVLLLIGPFALILTIMLVLAVAAGVLAAFVAVIASPYLLIRHLRAQGTVHAKPRADLNLFRKYRGSSGRLGSPQPKGVS
jgi:hypothetical protein